MHLRTGSPNEGWVKKKTNKKGSEMSHVNLHFQGIYSVSATAYSCSEFALFFNKRERHLLQIC